MTAGSNFAPDVDPRHVFLDARDVMARYGWGKTKGYQNLKDRDLTPPPVMRHPDRWRLDQLLDWEERRMAKTDAALKKVMESDPGSTNLFPQPKKRRRSALTS